MKRKICRAAVLFLLAAMAVLVWDGQTRLVTSEYSCEIAGLPESLVGFRIVQLSDLHGAEFGENNERLIERVREAQPDLIALTGDFVDEEKDLAATAALLPALGEIAPCYYVSGNHEWASGCIRELLAQLEEAGVCVLQNEYMPISRDGEQILLCGVEDPNSWADMITPDALVERACADYPGLPVILLGHRNYWAKEYPELPAELILCGHAHGGIIRLPLLGGLLGTERDLFPDYSAGLYESGTYTMVVSRGLGNVLGIPRFLNNPEIVILRLEKEA